MQPASAGETPSSFTASGWALIAANLVPLAGVAFWGWKVADVVLLYWIENLIIGVTNVMRIAAADPQHLVTSPKGGTGVKPAELPLAKAVLIGFFITHYGAFWAGHGTVLAEVFGLRHSWGGHLGIGDMMAGMLRELGLLAAIVGLLLSHFLSFRLNYIGREEYRHVDVASLMTRPYSRVVVVHLFILAGGLALQGWKSPVAAMLAFVVIKTAIDFDLHRRERNILSQLPDSASAR